MAQKLNIEIVTDRGIRFLEFKELKDAGIPHLMTTNDYNTGLKSCGDPIRLEQQYRHVLELLNASPDKFWLLEQIHSDRVVQVSSDLDGESFPPGQIIRKADGMVTDESGISMATTFADCVPLVLYDPVHHVLSNIHSGWKGTLHQIGKAGLQEMVSRFGTRPQEVVAFLGPHIQAKDFEVRQDLKDAFQREFGETLNNLPEGEYFSVKDEEHWTINLSKVIESMLKSLGIEDENIYIAQESTFELKDLFHSWRRDGNSFGIMSLVTVNP